MSLNKLTAFSHLITELGQKPNAELGMTWQEVLNRLQLPSTELQTTINAIIDKLSSTADNDSGADNILATPINNIDGNTVQKILEALTEVKLDKSLYNSQVINAGSSNAEIVDARGMFDKLLDRLNDSDLQVAENLQTTNANIANVQSNKADKSYVDSKIGSMGSTKTYKGSCTYVNLPTSGMTVDDYWYVTDKSTNYCWNGSVWGDIGNNINLGDGTVTDTKVPAEALSLNKVHGLSQILSNNKMLNDSDYKSEVLNKIMPLADYSYYKGVYFKKAFLTFYKILSAKIIDTIGIFIVPQTTLSGNILAKVFLNGTLVTTKTILNSDISHRVPFTTFQNAEQKIQLDNPLGLNVGDILCVAWEHLGTENLSMVYKNIAEDDTKEWGINAYHYGDSGYVQNMTIPPAIVAGDWYLPINAYQTQYSININSQGAEIIKNTDSRIKYGGSGWQLENSANDYSGSDKYSAEVNDNISCTFTGTGFNYYSVKSQGLGIAEIFIDGASQGKYDLYNATVLYKQKIFSVPNLAYGQHTIKINVTGTKNVNASNCYIDIDYLEILNSNGKEAINPIVPKRVYTTVNDIVSGIGASAERHYSLLMYLDYLLNQRTDIIFKNGKDKYFFDEKVSDDGLTFNNGQNVLDQMQTVEFSSTNYCATSANVVQRSTKASVTSAKKIMALVVGDSVTDGFLANGQPYWAALKKLFMQEDIDFGNSGARDIQLLGSKSSANVSFTYKSVTKNVNARAEGRGGWTLYSYLRHSAQKEPNQATWDLLGLGNGTHTDYTGTAAQRDLIATTAENNTAATVDNPFFDNSKSDIKFSIAKWLSQYKTLDDNGNRLVLGNGTGSLITADNLNSIDVGTPNVVIIQLGHNDFSRVGTMTTYYNNMLALIAEIRSELPNAYIIMSLNPPLLGLWNKEWYPNYSNIPDPYTSNWYDNAAHWVDYFKNYDEVTNKIFLLPTYFMTPTAEAFYDYPSADGFGNTYHKPFGGGNTYHANKYAHANWGYQLYGLLKYIQTLG